jgi:hypothetical protein
MASRRPRVGSARVCPQQVEPAAQQLAANRHGRDCVRSRRVPLGLRSSQRPAPEGRAVPPHGRHPRRRIIEGRRRVGLNLPACDPRAAASPTQLRPRVAALRLRTSAGPVRTRVWWPASQDPGATVGLLLFFVDARVGVAGPGTSAAWPRELSSRAGIVIVSAPCAPTPHAVIRPCLRNATTAWNRPPIMPRSSKPIPDGCLSADRCRCGPRRRRGARGAESARGRRSPASS